MSSDQCISIIKQNAQLLDPDPPQEFYQHCTWPFIEHVDRIFFKNLQGLALDIYGTLVVSAAGDISLGEKRHDSDGAFHNLLTRWDLPYSADVLIKRIGTQIFQMHSKAQSQGISYPEIDIRQCWSQIFWQDYRSGFLSAKSYKHFKDVGNIEYFSTDYETVVNPVAPMPGLKPLLELISRQNNILPGIVSNAQFYTPLLFPAFTSRTLEEYGFDPGLQYYSYQFGRGKPSIELYESLADAYKLRNISPSMVLFVGNDLLKDCWAASQAGFKTGLFAGDIKSLRLHQKDERLRGFKPDLVIRNLEELVQVLG